MKRIILGLALLCAVRCSAQVAMMKLDDIPGDRLVCVTNWGPYVTSSIAGMQNVITNMASTQYVASVISPLTRRVSGLEVHTNNADIHLTAEQRQRIEAAVTNETDAVALAALSGHTSNTNLHLTAEQRQRIAEASAHGLRADNPHGVTAAQAGAVSTNDARYKLALTNEADTLASVAARGGFAGTETIGPLIVQSMRFGTGAGAGASGNSWGAYGWGAGLNSVGDSWSAHGWAAGANVTGNRWVASGYSSGNLVVGDDWSAYGFASGLLAHGNKWCAFGYLSGMEAAWTNSQAFGGYAGRKATGNNRLYIDVYSADPNYSANGATNDMIFGDNGQLNLGRTGSLTNSAPNQLRGNWQLNGKAIGGLTTNDVDARVALGVATRPTYAEATNAAAAVVAAGGFAPSNSPALFGVPTLNGTNLCEVCPQWIPLVFGQLASDIYGHMASLNAFTTFLNTGYSNRFALISNPYPYDDSIVRAYVYAPATATPSFTVGTIWQYANATLLGGAWTNQVVCPTSYAPPTPITFFVPAGGTNGSAAKCYFMRVWLPSFPNHNISVLNPMARKATETERALWNAGTWNPTNSWQ